MKTCLGWICRDSEGQKLALWTYFSFPGLPPACPGTTLDLGTGPTIWTLCLSFRPCQRSNSEAGEEVTSSFSVWTTLAVPWTWQGSRTSGSRLELVLVGFPGGRWWRTALLVCERARRKARSPLCPFQRLCALPHKQPAPCT